MGFLSLSSLFSPCHGRSGCPKWVRGIFGQSHFGPIWGQNALICCKQMGCSKVGGGSAKAPPSPTCCPPDAFIFLFFFAKKPQMVKLRIVSKRDPVGSALQIPKTRRGRVPGCVPPLPPPRCHRVTVPLSSWCGQGSVAKAFPRTGSGSKRQEQLGQLAGHLLQRRRRRRLRPARFPSPKRPPPAGQTPKIGHRRGSLPPKLC